MDPVSHLLFGRTVALTVPGRSAVRGMTSALLLGSIMPDIDSALAPRGFDLYLRAHASGTHSLVGAASEAVVLALGLRVVVRGSRFLNLLVASSVGLLGHVFWDLADGSDISILKPFSTAVFGWHLVAMGDPIVLALVAAAVVFAWRWPAYARPVAIGTIGALGLLLSVKTASQQWARDRYLAAVAAEPPQARAIVPEIGRVFEFTIYDRAADRVRAWRVDGRTGEVSLVFERRDALDGPLVARSRELPVVRAFLALSQIPFVRVETDAAQRLVLWSDARSCSVFRCDVSFGGAFDTKTVPLYQLIRIGGFSQRFPLPLDRTQ